MRNSPAADSTGYADRLLMTSHTATRMNKIGTTGYPGVRYLLGAAGSFRRSTNRDEATSPKKIQSAKITDVVI